MAMEICKIEWNFNQILQNLEYFCLLLQNLLIALFDVAKAMRQFTTSLTYMDFLTGLTLIYPSSIKIRFKTWDTMSMVLFRDGWKNFYLVESIFYQLENYFNIKLNEVLQQNHTKN